MLFSAIFAMVVGVMMIAQWTLTITRGQVPGPDDDAVAGRGRTEMTFHWIAEFATAIALIVGGLDLILKWGAGVELFLVAAGMLVYAVVNNAGYFAQLRQWPPVVMFGVILALDVVAVVLVV